MPEQQAIAWATIGQVVAPFGVQGELKIRPLTDIPNRFAELEAVYLGPEHSRHLIKRVRPYKGEMIILKLEGIEDATTAEVLRNFDLSIPISQLAKLPPDSYYQHDILGLQVATLDGRNLGKIVDIMVTGSNDVYVIEATGGRQILIPAIKEVIKQVDLMHNMVYIDPIVGLLDDQEAVIVGEEEENQPAESSD